MSFTAIPRAASGSRTRSPASGRRWGRVALAAAVAASFGLVSPAAHADTPEDAVKAVYLFKFAPFVDWPPSAFATPASPLQLCILGDDPFGATLDQAVSGHQVASHPIEVRRLQSAAGAAGCHILYFRGPRNAALADAFAHMRGSPVLTVTEEDGAASGWIIRFTERDGRVRFSIDSSAAAANGVRISSKLLALAAPVRPGS